MARTLEISASIFDLPRSLILTGSAEQHREAVSTMGVNGLQYARVRNVRGQKVARELMAIGWIVSLHQSFVNGGGFSEDVKGAARELTCLATMPTLGRSLDQLVSLQTIAAKHGGRKPVVVHPNEQYVGDRPIRRLIDYRVVRDSGAHGPLLHQPTIEVLERWGVLWAKQPERTAQDMLSQNEQRGFAPGQVALDLNHLMAERGSKNFTLDWCARFAGELAAQGALDGPGELQVSFRPDFGGSLGDLDKALNGRLAKSRHGEVIEAIAERLPQMQTDMRITLEVPPSAFSNEIIDIGYVVGHQRLVTALGESVLAA